MRCTGNDRRVLGGRETEGDGDEARQKTGLRMLTIKAEPAHGSAELRRHARRTPQAGCPGDVPRTSNSRLIDVPVTLPLDVQAVPD